MSVSIPEITVIITAYNAKETIARLIDSIVNQEGINKHFTLQIIAVDDCSTDNTASIIQSYHQVTYLKTEKNSGGPNKGRNLGLSLATGNYICIVDHDDEWHTDRIIKVIPFFNKATVITSGFTVKNSRTNTITQRVNKAKEKNFNYFDTNVTFIQKLKRNFGGQITYLGSIVFSKKLKNILFEEIHGMVDFDWILKLFHHQTSIEVCEPLYTRYVNGENLSLNEKYRLLECDFNVSELKKYQHQYPAEVRDGIMKTYGSMGRYYYVIGDMQKSRYYFKLSHINYKTIFYYLTTYFGAKFIKKHFNIFG